MDVLPGPEEKEKEEKEIMAKAEIEGITVPVEVDVTIGSHDTERVKKHMRSDEVAAFVFERLKLQDPLTVKFVERLLSMASLFDVKQLDYGPRNISEFGEPGVVVRMNDKFARIRNLLFPKGQYRPVAPANESMDDTYMDVANYAVIALMVRHGEWPS